MSWIDKIVGKREKESRDWKEEKREIEELEKVAYWLLKFDKEFFNMAMDEAKEIKLKSADRWNKIMSNIEKFGEVKK